MISWIKLDVNILDDAKIKIIRSHPNGDTVVLLWIGLLCLAMKSARPGTIEISDGLPYTVDDLSNLFGVEKKTVEMGIALFCKYRMIDVFQGGSIEVINFAKRQNIEEIERKRDLTRARVERYRDKQRTCNALLTHDSVTVTPTDKDKDKEKNIACVYDDAFLAFWNVYPKKRGKRAAFEAWKKAKGKPAIGEITSAVENQKRARQKANDAGQFFPEWPDPQRWISKARWEDEVEQGERRAEPKREKLPTPEEDLAEFNREWDRGKA